MSKKDRFRSQPTPPTGTRRLGKGSLLPKALAFAVASCFAADLALANPLGMSVVNGQVTFNHKGNTLTLTNSPGSIINWQSFSIGANEITRFIQQSAASSVLNRVKGGDPSLILGALQSQLANGITAGRVFLINPSGIVFGAGARIDVGGLVASTLNLSDSDFLANRLRFTEVPGAGSITNQGAITTPTGGQIYLIAPNVQNTGIITSPQGEVILAAGRSVELVDAATPNLRVEITAPDTEAVNVGQIIANSGKIGIYSALIRNSGTIRADGVVQGANGEILLKATNNVTLESGGVLSASGTANGVGGGIISGAAPAITNAGLIQVNAADNASAGNISMIAQDMVTLADTSRVEARGADINSQGGNVYFYSFGDALARNGQVIDLSGGTQSGNAGNGEFSARGHLTFGGSLLGSVAPGYNAGLFLIDPFTLNFESAAVGINTTIQSGDNILITGPTNIGSGITLTMLADHRSSTPGEWDDGRFYVDAGETGTIGVGAINIAPGVFTIAGNPDGTSRLIMFAAGGGIGTDVEPVRTNLNGGSLSVFTNNPDQVGLADTFITNGASAVNIARFDDGVRSNSFRLDSAGNITQSGPITVSGLAVRSVGALGGVVDLSRDDNLIDTLAGVADTTGGDGLFTFKNAQALTIGTVLGVSGINADGDSSATINVTTSTGALTVSNEVRANSDEGNATVTLTAPTSMAVNGDVTAIGNADATVTLTSGTSMAVSGAVLADANFDNATVTLISGTSMVVDGPVSAIGNDQATVIMTSGTSMVVSGDVLADAGNNDAIVTLTSGTSMAVNGAVSADSSDENATVTMVSGTSMLVDGPVDADGGEGATVTLTANNGSLTVNNTVNADGAEGATISLLTLNGAIDVTAAGAISATAGSIDADIFLTATGGAINVNGAISATGDDDARVFLTANGGGAINVNAAISANAEFDDARVVLETTGGGAININVDGALSATATEDNARVLLTANGGGAINVNGALSATAVNDAEVALTANGGGSIALNADVTADGGEGATITLAAFNGAITQTAERLLSAIGRGTFSEIDLTAANGIGNFGSPIQLAFGVDPFLDATNTSSGNIVLSQAAGDMAPNNIFNNAPGGAVDLTAVSGDINANFISSQGAITLRSTVAEGQIQIADGAEGAGIVTFIADNMDIAGPVSSGAGVINLRTFTAARPIFLSSAGLGGALELSQAEIDNLNGGNGVFVGDQVARDNPITFKNPTTIAGVINLFGSSVTQDPLATIAGGLLVGVGPGDVTLTEAANAINRFSTSGAVTGNVNLFTTSNIALGPVQATGAVNVTSGGAITDGNPLGADVIASAVALTAATGIGTLADPLETQVGSPLSLISASGDIGVFNVGNVELTLSLAAGGNISFANIGDVVLDSLTFSGVAAVVDASGFMSLGSPIAVTASDGLALIGGAGLTVDKSVSVAGGDLTLSGGSGNLIIAAPSGGLSVSGRDIGLTANNISVTGVDGGEGGPTTVHAARNLGITAFNDLNIRGGAVDFSPVVVRADGNVAISTGNDMNLLGGGGNSSSVEIRNDSGTYSIFSGRDVNLQGGTGNDAYALLFGNPDVDMSIGRFLTLDDRGGGPGAFARIESGTDTTIRILMRGCATGCIFVNGVEVFVVDGVPVFFDPVTLTGFVAGGSPAILGVGGIVVFGEALPPSDVNQTVATALSFITDEINSSSDFLLSSEREEDQQEAKKDEKGPAVCS